MLCRDYPLLSEPCCIRTALFQLFLDASKPLCFSREHKNRAASILRQRLTDMVVGQGNPQVPANEGGAVTENGQPTTSNNGEDVWDEQRIEDALKTLKEMHIQVSSCDCLQ